MFPAGSGARFGAMNATAPISTEPAGIESDPRWRAVLTRDRAADDAFFYSVRTTGVYCRPSCASRAPRSENVAFHATTADAERAGFRPCRRCRPTDPPRAQREAALVADLCRMIQSEDELPSVEHIATRAGLSASRIHRLFKSVTGITPKAYATAHRAGRVRDELRHAASVTEAIYESGYNSGGRFYESSGDMLGMTPRRFRNGGDRTEIRFAIGQCSLGAILVAATTVGVCAISLGDDAEALVRDLEQRFPRANLVGADPSFEKLVANVVGLVEYGRAPDDLPLDIRGTVFQQRVWTALRDIPVGKTATYAEVARAIGSPAAVRAVARACASNPLAVAIPCHRVVRTDGSASGYRWGIDRKRSLLDRESCIGA